MNNVNTEDMMEAGAGQGTSGVPSNGKTGAGVMAVGGTTHTQGITTRATTRITRGRLTTGTEDRRRSK